jgi:toxin ParE1/3/4
MQYTVIFTPEAQEQLASLYRYLAAVASPQTAERYTSAVVTACEDLRTFPHQGTSRHDLRPGLRMTHYKGRAMIAFAVDADQVSIIGVFYGGQDYQAFFQSDLED